MGRPKKISSQFSKLEDKSTVPKNTNVRTELVSKMANLSADKVEFQVTRKRVTLNPNIEVIFAETPSSKKMRKTMSTPVRRSPRLQDAALPLDAVVDCLAEEMTVIVSDDEYENANDIETRLEDKNLEEQVQYLLRVVKEQHEVLNALKSKTTTGACSEASNTRGVTYKSLYIDSKMKMEVSAEENILLHKKAGVLVEENHQLNKKLEHALGKIEVFERGTHMSLNVLEKLKGVIVCSLTKESEANKK